MTDTSKSTELSTATDTALEDEDALDGIDAPNSETVTMLSSENVKKSSLDVEDMDQGQESEVIETEQEVQKAPDGGWGWFIVLSSFFVHVLMGGFERSNGVFYLQMKDKYDRSATATAWVLSVFSTLRLAMGPVASIIANKFSCRFVTMLGAVICSIGIFVSAFVPDLYYLYFTYGVLGGVGRSFAYTPALIIVGYYFNKRRGLAVGLATSGVGLGCFVFPPAIEIMFNTYGFSGTFIVLAAVIANFFVCGALFRPLELQRQIVKNDSLRKNRKAAGDYGNNLLPKVSMAARQQNMLKTQSAAKMSSSMEITANLKIESRKSSLWRTKLKSIKKTFQGSKSKQKDKKPLLELSLFRNFAFTALCIQIFLFTLSFNSTFVFLPALAKEKGISPIYGAYLVSILGFFDMIARIVMSTLLDLKQVKPYRLIIYNAVMFMNAVVSVLMPSVRTFWQFAVVCGLYGTLSGTYISQKSVVIVDVLGVEKLSSSFGLLLLFQGLSALVGPTVGGILKDFLGSYDMAFYFGSIGIVAGGIMMACGNVWLYKQKKHSQQAKSDSSNSTV